MKKMLLIFLIGIGFASCQFAIEDHVVDNYYMIATDIGEQCSLSYKDSDDSYGTVIQECVYSVGFNDDYIVAKQHPFEFSKGLDKSIVQYYILPIKAGMNWKTNNDLIGPLSSNQFESEIKRLDIEDIEFTMNYEYME